MDKIAKSNSGSKDTADSSETRSFWSSRLGTGLAVIGGVTGLLATSGVITYGMIELVDGNSELRAQRHKAVAAEAQEDGFEATEAGIDYVSDSSKDTKLVIGLGHCSMNNVKATVTFNGDQVDEVFGYHVTGYSLPVEKEGRTAGKNGRDYTYHEGVQTTFYFDNLQDLKDNILGPEPCQTLAQSYVPPTTVRR